jgi:adenylate cyclase
VIQRSADALLRAIGAGVMKSLLFIDDEEGVRRSVQRALRREPYDIQTVSDGRDAIGWVRRHITRTAIVISDYKMPGLDGIATLTAIGRLNPEIIRIILTGYATVEAAIEATNEGIDGFLTKPFDNAELRATIREIAIRKRLRQFVSKPVYDQIRASPVVLEPRCHEVTVLFSDIRNFTARTRNWSSRQVVRYLNDCYFSPMSEVAHNYGGTVDKHIGDGIMVVFGSPVRNRDDATRAVRAAAAMQQAAAAIDHRLRRRLGLRLQTGIGIATGNVFSGMVGSHFKREYTCIGLAVNLAARLQARAGSGEILLHEKTLNRIRLPLAADCRGPEPMPPMQLKGIAEPVRVYRLRVAPARGRPMEADSTEKAAGPQVSVHIPTAG